MTEILANVEDKQAVIQAIEGNAAELLLAMGRAGGGEEYHEPYITWTIGGSPINYHNAVVHTDLSQTPLSADAVIESIIKQFQAHGVPGSWHLGSIMMRTSFGQMLVEHGFQDAGGEPGMAVDLAKLNEASAPGNLVIEQVHDDDQLDLWAQTLAQDFGEGEREANWVRDIYRTIGLGEDTAFRHYLGWLDNKAVATASMFSGVGAAGIYFVMTVPEARRQGIGAAITLAALRDAQTMGYRVGVLGASGPGYPVYKRIGFQEYCQIGIYEWHLPE